MSRFDGYLVFTDFCVRAAAPNGADTETHTLLNDTIDAYRFIPSMTWPQNKGSPLTETSARSLDFDGVVLWCACLLCNGLVEE